MPFGVCGAAIYVMSTSAKEMRYRMRILIGHDRVGASGMTYPPADFVNQHRSTLELCEAIVALEDAAAELKREVESLTGKNYEEFLDGMRKLLGMLP
jgi:hypothetical protein